MKRPITRWATVATVAAALCGCATTPPVGPHVAVLPRPGQSLDDFRQQDLACRDYGANASAARTTAANGSAGAAVAGAGLGAATGALIGSAGGHAGNGAAIGAGGGLLLGSLAGARRAERATQAAQRIYDTAYAQCMSAAGERVPGPPPRPAIVYAPPVYAYPPPPVVYAPPPY